ncbi:MAG: trigger factor [Desulfobacterales bacterium]|nr:trigger factor [Desulfobacterales bacterium]
MKTKVEDITPVKKKILVEIETREVDKKLNETYGELGKKAKVPGFRPGKVPRKILESRFGNQVEQDVTRDLINDSLPKALEEIETFPLGAPILEKGPLKSGQDFKYSAIMEVRPQFELKDYLGIEVEKEKFSVTEKDIQKGLDQIRSSHGKLVPIEPDRPVKKDDYVVLDYGGFEGGQALDDVKASNFLIHVGGNEFHPKFEESLIGLKKDSEAEIDVDFEENHYNLKLAGKSVNFKVKILEIKDLELPEINDEFAKNLGADFNDLKELKAKVEESISQQEEERIDKELKQRLLEKISASVEFELPQILIESETNYSLEQVKQNLTRSGSSLEKAGLSEEKLRENFRPTAEKRTKEMLILGEISSRDKITVTEEDLAKGFAQLAAKSGQSVDMIKKVYKTRNLEDSLRQELLEEKTLNYLVEHASISIVESKALSQNKDSEKEGN